VVKTIPIQQRDSGYQSNVNDWQKFLKCWATRQIDFAKEQGGNYTPELSGLDVDDPIRIKLIQSEIARIEKRIGLKLPKSYRDFLEAGGGNFRFDAGVSSEYIDYFLPLGKIGWLHEVFPDTHKAITDHQYFGFYSPDDKYYRYEDGSDALQTSRDRYLHKILVVGYVEGEGVLLLNPHEITADGEWEAWMHYWEGSERHLSFAKLARDVFLNTAFDPPRNSWPISDATLNETCAKHLAPRKTGLSTQTQP
jgi:hypothetical protein